MSFIVQDDTGLVANAHAYINVATFKAYHDDRGQVYTPYTDDQIQHAIVLASDFLDNRFNFIGFRLNDRAIQITQWPRRAAYDKDQQHVQGIPREVKWACAEYALRALAGPLNPDLTRDATGAVIQSKSEQVGPISESVTFVDGGVISMPRYPQADVYLIRAGLVKSGGTVSRG